MHPDEIKTVETTKPKAKEDSLDLDSSDQEPLYRFHEEQDGLAMSALESNVVPSSFYHSIAKGELVPSKNQFP